MAGQHHTVRFRGIDRLVLQLYGFAGLWAVNIDGAWYGLPGDSPDAVASRFVRERLRNVGTPPEPALVASQRYPLLLRADRVAVRAWPAFLPRGRGAKTYVNPATGDRVATTRGPLWMFESKHRQASECGSVSLEQTVDDVRDLAKIWLRSQVPP